MGTQPLTVTYYHPVLAEMHSTSDFESDDEWHSRSSRVQKKMSDLESDNELFNIFNRPPVHIASNKGGRTTVFPSTGRFIIIVHVPLYK